MKVFKINMYFQALSPEDADWHGKMQAVLTCGQNLSLTMKEAVDICKYLFFPTRKGLNILEEAITYYFSLHV